MPEFDIEFTDLGELSDRDFTLLRIGLLTMYLRIDADEMLKDPMPGIFKESFRNELKFRRQRLTELTPEIEPDTDQELMIEMGSETDTEETEPYERWGNRQGRLYVGRKYRVRYKLDNQRLPREFVATYLGWNDTFNCHEWNLRPHSGTGSTKDDTMISVKPMPDDAEHSIPQLVKE